MISWQKRGLRIADTSIHSISALLMTTNSTETNSTLASGFALGPWRINPRNNIIIRGSIEKHLENRLMQTLVFLCENQGQTISRQQFFDSVWQGRIVNEEALSRAISLLRTALEDDAHRPTYIQTIPGKGYRLIMPVKAASPAEPTTHIAVEAPHNSIAVLPFANLSDDPGNEYFSDGVSEEILNTLVQTNSFKVVGRTSSFAFKNRNEDLRQIGRTLTVSHVLEGSVRKAGNRARITAQLIKTNDGFHLWSDTFEFELDNIFTIQADIASAVVSALKIHILGDITSKRETSPDAYANYLRAIYFLRSGEADRIKKARQLFEQVLSADNDYAPAWVGLADAYWYLISYGEIPKAGNVEAAVTASNRALEFDEQLAEAHLSQAMLLMNFQWDWPGAKQAIDRARHLAPGNARVILQAGNLASATGQFEEAVRLLTLAVSTDPLNTTGHIWLALSHMYLEQFEKAKIVLRQALDLNPQRVVANMILGRIHLLEGDAAAAHEQMQLEPAGFWRDYGLTLSQYALGYDAAADSGFESLVGKYAHEGPFQIAEIYAFRSDIDNAFQWLDTARENQDNGLTELLGSPFLSSLRSDARWDALTSKMAYPSFSSTKS